MLQKPFFFFKVNQAASWSVPLCVNLLLKHHRRESKNAGARYPSLHWHTDGARLISHSLADRDHLGEEGRIREHLDKLSITNEMSGWSRRHEIGSDHSS